MRLLVCIIISLLFISITIYPQEYDSIKVTLQPVVVTALRIPIKAAYTSRTINLIDFENIKKSGALCVEELLQTQANIDVQSRGVFGVQSDIAIRGGLFSQNVILLNGVRINDVQTAHHNFDLPIAVGQIERIEVLKGSASALYGADAFSGVINIIPRVPDEQALMLKLSGGQHKLLNGSIVYDFSMSNLNSSNIIEHRKSDGFRWGTDFKITTLASNNTLSSLLGKTTIFGGYTEKEFGALNFYGKSPSREWTKTTFINLSNEFDISSLQLQVKVSYRKHNDKFMFDVRTPDRYVNIHTTHNYIGELLTSFKLTESFTVISGLEGNSDNIISTNLGNHRRSSFSFLINLHNIFAKSIIFDLGLRQDFHSDFKNQLNPSTSIAYLLSSSDKIFISTGRSFRAPSYTELYYKNPKRMGNPNLKPEIGWSHEVGGEFKVSSHIDLSIALFQRNQNNIIDYVRFTSSDSIDKATNFATAVTRGIDLHLKWTQEQFNRKENHDAFSIQQFTFSYTYLDSQIDIGNIFSTVYSFKHPRHQISTGIHVSLPYSLFLTTHATHKIKLNGKSYTLVDAKLQQTFSQIVLFFQGTNLLNQSYEEIIGVPLPGRWVWAGVEIKVL